MSLDIDIRLERVLQLIKFSIVVLWFCPSSYGVSPNYFIVSFVGSREFYKKKKSLEMRTTQTSLS